MKKYIVFIIALFLVSSTGLLAQTRTLKQVMELQMPKTADDELCGTRGAGVCWNPITQKYYAAFNESPTIIEAQAFESAKILRDQISSGYRSRSSLSYQLKSMGRTSGAYSEIRMNTNHELVRPLNLFELSSSVIKKID